MKIINSLHSWGYLIYAITPHDMFFSFFHFSSCFSQGLSITLHVNKSTLLEISHNETFINFINQNNLDYSNCKFRKK